MTLPKNASVKQTLVPESARMNASSFGAQPQVERVDHAGPEERGVVQLEELVAVQRHDREAVGTADTQTSGSAPATRATRSRCCA